MPYNRKDYRKCVMIMNLNKNKWEIMTEEQAMENLGIDKITLLWHLNQYKPLRNRKIMIVKLDHDFLESL